jgi:hypothetical protein
MYQCLGWRRADVAAEDRGRLVDTPVVARPAVPGLRYLLLHRLRNFQWTADGAGRENLELDLATRQRVGLLGKALGEMLQMHAARP